jgi:hypothetical protein
MAMRFMKDCITWKSDGHCNHNICIKQHLAWISAGIIEASSISACKDKASQSRGILAQKML